MVSTSLPSPVRLRSDQPYVDVRGLEKDLRATVDGEVRFDPGSRGAYSTDASNYRQVPICVVLPRTVDAAVETVAVAHRHRAPVVSRGGGTSLAGQACNAAVVIDWSKYVNHVVSIDADARACVVEPGLVLDRLNDAAAPYGLMFGPKPATHDHCTLGGMIGNNSCGATAQAYGKTVDNVLALEVLTHDGRRFWVGDAGEAGVGLPPEPTTSALRALVEDFGEAVRARYPDIPRRVSGYNLDSLLPENGFDVARALVGSESTLVTVLHARLRLVDSPGARTTVVLGYQDIVRAAHAAPAVAAFEPEQLEGLDDRLIEFERERRMNPQALRLLPEGNGWLMVVFAGDDQEQADDRAHRMLDGLAGTQHEPTYRFYDDPDEEALLVDVREVALGATARVPGMPDTWEGWEDSAVPPDKLGQYLTDLRALFDEFGYSGATLYGHFGQGCVHTRIAFDLTSSAGIATFRGFIARAADLVASYGGSYSGEHGDGQSKAEFLPRLYGPEVVEAFRRIKTIFDPDHLMNPGKIVDPYRIDENLRLGADWSPTPQRSFFGYPEDNGQFDRAVMRCVGVGKCRHESGGVMCPSYMVTKEEEHSTRGRSRLLFEMLAGHADSPVTAGWRSPEVRDALDLCLACKGCRKDCPVEVDMATMKAEFLAHHYAHRLRPRSHYSLGWLPLTAQLAGRMAPLANAVTGSRALHPALSWLAGIDPQRSLPSFAPTSLQKWYARRGARGDGRLGEVVLWPDTFTNHLTPQVGQAAVEVLECAGWRVRMPTQPVCCGLTWISTGQLSTAQRVLRRTRDALAPAVRRGAYVVGLEPSCTAVFRNDAPELLPADRDVERLRTQTVTLAELLTQNTPDWQPPAIDAAAVVQTHCHQHAVLGYDADRELMGAAGIRADVLDSGCCGLAGNFGFERGHYNISRAIGERVLLPAVRAATDDTLVLADGFSCRTQIEQGTDRRALHLAQALAGTR